MATRIVTDGRERLYFGRACAMVDGLAGCVVDRGEYRNGEHFGRRSFKRAHCRTHGVAACVGVDGYSPGRVLAVFHAGVVDRVGRVASLEVDHGAPVGVDVADDVAPLLVVQEVVHLEDRASGAHDVHERLSRFPRHAVERHDEWVLLLHFRVAALHESEGVDEVPPDGVQVGAGPGGQVDAFAGEGLFPALHAVDHDDQVRGAAFCDDRVVGLDLGLAVGHDVVVHADDLASLHLADDHALRGATRLCFFADGDRGNAEAFLDRSRKIAHCQWHVRDAGDSESPERHGVAVGEEGNALGELAAFTDVDVDVRISAIGQGESSAVVHLDHVVVDETCYELLLFRRVQEEPYRKLRVEQCVPDVFVHAFSSFCRCVVLLCLYHECVRV